MPRGALHGIDVQEKGRGRGWGVEGETASFDKLFSGTEKLKSSW
jgi:hypothetical protein